MHPTPFVFGFTTALLAVLIGWGYRHMSARHRCPECDAATTRVTLPTFGRKAVGSWLQKRWCGHCGWEGLSRRGPEFNPQRGPASHESGFHWNHDEPKAPGFEWGTTADAPKAPPHDPSGFVWARADVEPEAGSPLDHPSGFRWSDSDSGDATDRRGFAWGQTDSSTSAPKGGFLWGKRPERPPRGPAFEWKDSNR